ncbi:hypothetical protein [Gordonia aurantiaca]
MTEAEPGAHPRHRAIGSNPLVGHHPPGALAAGLIRISERATYEM